jgi:hypothetical protein
MHCTALRALREIKRKRERKGEKERKKGRERENRFSQLEKG